MSLVNAWSWFLGKGSLRLSAPLIPPSLPPSLPQPTVTPCKIKLVVSTWMR